MHVRFGSVRDHDVAAFCQVAQAYAATELWLYAKPA